MMRKTIAWLGAVVCLSFAQQASAQMIIELEQAKGPCLVSAPDRGEASPPAACAAAIESTPDKRSKAVLYFAWAYSLNEAGNALAALTYLSKAIELAPDFANALHERSYTRGELGQYDLALQDSDAAVRLFPNNVNFRRERAFSLFHMARFEEALAERNRVIELEGATPDYLIGRAETLMWLGRYDEAEADLKGIPLDRMDKSSTRLLDELIARRSYKVQGDPAARCTLKSISNKAQALALIGDCTWAFDHESKPAKRADYLEIRATARIVFESSTRAGIMDQQMALWIDPTNPDRHTNYGFNLLSLRRSWAARNSFDKALAIPGIADNSKAFALAGRGQANYNLGDKARALADAKASFEVKPNEAALLLLGLLARDRGDKAAAKAFWMAAWQRGVRDDDMRRNLQSVGIEDPDKEPQG